MIRYKYDEDDPDEGLVIQSGDWFQHMESGRVYIYRRSGRDHRQAPLSELIDIGSGFSFKCTDPDITGHESVHMYEFDPKDLVKLLNKGDEWRMIDKHRKVPGVGTRRNWP